MEEIEKKPKKKVGLLKKILLGLLAALILLIGVGAIYNAVKTNELQQEYANAYGAFADTPNGRINYTIYGEGAETIVLLPGHGSASPHFEFSELGEALSADFKIIIIEPLGYGLSDDTEAERTSENICEEVHAVLSAIGEDKYYLMGHSISGVYALDYANRYTDEVQGFIGIDASVPAQINDTDPGEQSLMMKLYRYFLVNTGYLRLSVSGISQMEDDYFQQAEFIGTPYSVMPRLSQEDRAVYAELMIERTANAVIVSEIEKFKDTALLEKDTVFPDTVPVLYMLSENTVNSIPNWLSYHEKLAANHDKSEVVTMTGTHYLHLCDAQAVADKAKAWIQQ